MNVCDVYDALGANYREAVVRLGNRDRVERFLTLFLSQSSFDELEAAMNCGDMEAAFIAAHNLKGVTGSLALTRLCERVIPFVEMLRKGRDIPGAVAAYPAVKEMYLFTIDKLRIYEAEKNKLS